MSETGNVIERLAEWSSALEFDRIPRRVLDECKNQVLSVIAAVHSGHFTEAGRVVSKRLKDWAGGKEATLIPSGERTSLHNAVFGNAALGMALEYDDYSAGSHGGTSTVVAALAMAEKQGVSGRDFLVAQAAANEIQGRLGLATRSAASHPRLESFVHQAGAAVVGARLLALDGAQTASALALSLLQPGHTGWPTFLAGEGRLMVGSLAAPQGLAAADMAAGGLRGPSDLLERLDLFDPSLLRGAAGGLGSNWLCDTLSFKLYPGTLFLDTILDCVLHLVRTHTIDPKKVKAVQVATLPETVEIEEKIAPLLDGPKTPPLTLNYAVRYNVAAALIDKELTPRQFLREKIKEPLVWDLAGRVVLAADEELTRRARESSLFRRISGTGEERRALDLEHANLAGFRNSMGARVRIEMEDGRTHEAEEEVPLGGAGRAADERRATVEDKFRRETRYTLRKEKMEKAIDLIEHLEEAASSHLREIVRLCCSERS